MLTPMDIQEKRFHAGIGFEKKDVLTFFDSVSESYEKLYRSNAELKERVTTLEDKLQHYKTKEHNLEKSILLAEKDSEDKKSKASKEAKNIELEAKNKAKLIIGDAEERLVEIENKITELNTQYAAYKSSLASLLKLHLTHLKEEDFDADAFIDPRFAGAFMGGGAVASQPSGSGASFEFNGDPQMRDQSTLGGSGYLSTNADAKATSSEVYTSLMKDNENFVDPFNTEKQQTGRYNPYDGRTQKSEKKSGSTTFTVANSNKNKNRTKYAAYTPDSKKNNSATTNASKSDIKADTKTTFTNADSKSNQAHKNTSNNKSSNNKASNNNSSSLDDIIKAREAEKAEKARKVQEAKEAAIATAKAKEEEERAKKLAEAEAQFAEQARMAKEAEDNRLAEESKAAEETRNKAKEFFKKAADEKQDNNNDKAENTDNLVGEVEDEETVNGKLLIGDDEGNDENGESDFEFF